MPFPAWYWHGMSIWTRAELLELISQWKKAYLAVSSGKSYTIGGRSLTRQDVSVIRAQLESLARELDALDNPGRGSLRSIPCRTVR